MKKLAFITGLVVVISCQQNKKEEIQTPVTANISCSTPAITDKEWYSKDNVAPLFEKMGNLHFPISTDNELVQKYFDQGLTLAYGFNHAEAARSFYYASKLDPDCAMAYWGFAYVLGPNYNAGMEPDNLKQKFGKQVSFCGGVDTQDLLVNGSPDQVREKVDELRTLFPTGLIISPSHEAIMPDVPPANIHALFEEAQIVY